MKDSRALAYVNFYAAIGTLSAYCKYSAEAKEIAAKKDIAIRFKVKDGPDGVLTFKGGEVTAVPYAPEVPFDIGLACNSCDQFNALVAGEKVTPMPFKGLLKLSFVLDKTSAFNVLTDKMSKLMRAKEFATADEKKLATLLTFNAMAAAITQVGNWDPKGKVACKNWPEGQVAMEIPGECSLCIEKTKAGVLEFKKAADRPRAKMVFRNIDVAKGVIDGVLDAMTCIGTGDIRMFGMGWMLDNLNKCLNLVPEYLA